MEICKGYTLEIMATPKKFVLHNLRSSGASAAANNGISGRHISKQGHWSSEKAKNGYIKDSLVKRLTVSNMLEL